MRATSYISSTELSVAVTATDLTNPGAIGVEVVNVSGNITEYSSGLIFAITGPPTGRNLTLVSVSVNGTPANSKSGLSAISGDGRFVVFVSTATDLVTGGSSKYEQIYRRDTCMTVTQGCVPSTTAISVTADGSLGNGDSGQTIGSVSLPSISANGRFVTFRSWATNIAQGDTNGTDNIYLRDTCLGVLQGCKAMTTLVSVNSQGIQSNASSKDSVISPDGRFVAFVSVGSNLVSASNGGAAEVYVRDTCFGMSSACLPTTTLVSTNSAGQPGYGDSRTPSIASGGRFIAFASSATNLATGLAGQLQVFLTDTCFGATGSCIQQTTLMSESDTGRPGNGESSNPTLSADGKFVAFSTLASNLTATAVANETSAVLLVATCAGAPAGCVRTISLVSTGTYAGTVVSVNANSAINSDGRFVAFDSHTIDYSTEFSGITNIVLRDACPGTEPCGPSTIELSQADDGTPGDSNSVLPALSRDGRYLSFQSAATTFLAGGGNGQEQVFIVSTSH